MFMPVIFVERFWTGGFMLGKEVNHCLLFCYHTFSISVSPLNFKEKKISLAVVSEHTSFRVEAFSDADASWRLILCCLFNVWSGRWVDKCWCSRLWVHLSVIFNNTLCLFSQSPHSALPAKTSEISCAGCSPKTQRQGRLVFCCQNVLGHEPSHIVIL